MNFFKYIAVLICTITLCSAGFPYVQEAKATGSSYTVCPSGCDFTSLTDALAVPGLTADNITIKSDYVFDPLVESTNLSVPDSVTISCEANADKIGDSNELQRVLYLGNTTTLQNCSLENLFIDSSGTSGMNISNNTFSTTSPLQVVLTSASNFTISGNKGIQKVQLQNDDYGTISNNEFNCKFNDNCINFVTAGSGPFDWTSEADVSAHVAVTNNTFINFDTNSFGDYVNFVAGVDIDFTGNTIRSAVELDNTFTTMVSVQFAEVYMAHNYFIFPTRAPSSTTGSWGINIRVGDSNTNLVAEHNTLIMGGNQTSAYGNNCLGLYDNGTNTTTVQVNIEFNYNICYNPFQTAAGAGMQFFHFSTTSVINLSEKFNGFYNLQTLVNDQTGAITSVNSNSLTSDPVFRTANTDITDDYYLVPMSKYLDVDGTKDVGAYSGSRLNTYTIDDNCTVDYTNCYATDARVLTKVLSSNDSVYILAGSYNPFTVTSTVNNISLNGSGSTTIIDGLNGGAGLTFESLSQSNIQGLKIQNVNVNTTTIEYRMQSWALSAGGVDYNVNVDGSPLPFGIYVYNNCAGAAPLFSEPYNIMNGYEGIGTDNISLFLARIPAGAIGNPHEQLVTVYMPASLASTPAEIQSKCGLPSSFLEHYVTSIFTVQPDGSYVYNNDAVASAGVTVVGGSSTPTLIRDVTVSNSYGLVLKGSNNNTFTNLSFSNNSTDVYLNPTSTNNIFKSTTFTGFNSAIIAEAGVNKIQDSTFDPTKVTLSGTSTIAVYYTANINITDSSSTPLATATISISDSHGGNLTTGTVSTLGTTSAAILIGVLGNGNPTSLPNGSYNPYTFTASKSGYATKTSTSSIQTPFQIINFSLGLDVDGDGISSDVEDNAPNGGDINQDGIQDSTQADVSSIVNVTNSEYVGLQVAGGCTSITNLTSKAESELGTDSNFNYLNSLIGFNASCGIPGATAIVTLYFVGPFTPENLTLRKYANGAFYEISNITKTYFNLAGTPGLKVTYTIIDGGLNDADGVADGNITDPVGLATLVSTVSTTNGGSGGGTGGYFTAPVFQTPSTSQNNSTGAPGTLPLNTSPEQVTEPQAGSPLLSACYNQTKTLKIGSKGEEVGLLQRALSFLAIDVLDPVNIFGTLTKQAVTLFQKSNKISTTGTVGPITSKKLMELTCP